MSIGRLASPTTRARRACRPRALVGAALVFALCLPAAAHPASLEHLLGLPLEALLQLTLSLPGGVR